MFTTGATLRCATCSSARRTHTYAKVGTYTVSLTAKDNVGARRLPVSPVAVTSGGSGLPECPGSAEVLGRSCVRSNISVAAGGYAYMYVHSGVTSMRIKAS